MREDYKITKPIGPLSLQIENEVIDALKAMEGHAKLSVSELANTALKRFISAHKDFLPAEFLEKRKANNQR